MNALYNPSTPGACLSNALHMNQLRIPCPAPGIAAALHMCYNRARTLIIPEGPDA